MAAKKVEFLRKFLKQAQPSPAKYVLLEPESTYNDTRKVKPWYDLSTLSTRFWILHVLFFSISVVCGTLIASWRVSCSTSRSEPVATPDLGYRSFEIPVYSKESGKISDMYQETRFVGNPDAKSPFKGPPSTEVDAAWDSLWTANVLLSADEYAISSPQYPEAGVRDVNTKSPAYFATFEATHQLHCLVSGFLY
jgi:hypothetical protein